MVHQAQSAEGRPIRKGEGYPHHTTEGRTMNQLEQLNAWLTTAIEGFENDPADSPFQEGYKAALVETLKELLRIQSGTTYQA
jgi:hypothetical protein